VTERPASRRRPPWLGLDAASGVAVTLAAIGGLVLANTGWASDHARWLARALVLELGDHAITASLRTVLDEGLMTLVFLGLGLRLTRDLHASARDEPPWGVLPFAAAIGGAVVPALAYVALAPAGPAQRGLVIAMGSDLAVAAAALALVGHRLAPRLRVLLVATALLASVGAVVVGAVLHAERVVPRGLVVTAIGVVLALGMRRNGIRRALAYVVPGVVTWAGLRYAGLHPALAGAVMGILAPTDPGFGLRSNAPPPAGARSPAERVHAALQPGTALVVLPLFVLAHSAVELRGAIDPRIVLGVLVAMVIGKPLGIAAGIVAGTWLAGRLGLPGAADLGGRNVAVVGLLAGAGLSMGLWLAQQTLASPEALASARLGVLAAAVVCTALAVAIARLAPAAAAAGTAAAPIEPIEPAEPRAP
jgi:Na+:H+ antiporter, NhaA family